MNQAAAIVLVFFALNSVSQANNEGLKIGLEKAIQSYSHVVVASLTFGEVLKVGYETPCGLLFRGQIVKEVRGRFGDAEVAFLSNHGFSIGQKYLLFLSDKNFVESGRDRTRIVDGTSELYYGGEGKDWFDACASELAREKKKVYLAWRGTSLKYTSMLGQAGEQWLSFFPSQLLHIRSQLEIRPEKVTSCIEGNPNDCWTSRLRELVSEKSLLAWIAENGTSGQADRRADAGAVGQSRE